MKDPFYGRTPYNLLVVRMSDMSEVLFTLPAWHALRQRYPHTRKYWLIDAPYAPLLEGLDGLERAIPFERREITANMKKLERFWRAIGTLLAFVRSLRQLKLVGALIFQPRLRASLFGFFSGARIRLGYRRFAGGGALLLNRRIWAGRKRHLIDRHLALVARTGADATPKRVPIALREEDRQAVGRFLDDYRLAGAGYVLISPGASKPGKCWTEEGYAALADHIAANQELVPVLVGEGQEDARIKRILAAMQRKALIAPDLSIRELAALCEQAAYLIAPDTGPLHLANAMGTPVVGLYGPTDPQKRGPYFEPKRVVQAEGKLKRLSSRRLRGLDEPASSMKSLSVDAVVAACTDLWDEVKESRKGALSA